MLFSKSVFKKKISYLKSVSFTKLSYCLENKATESTKKASGPYTAAFQQYFSQTH